MQLSASLDVLQAHADQLPRDLCDACLGRLGARLGRDVPNTERGRLLRADRPSVDPSRCPLCEGISARFERYAELCREASAPYEHASFLVGSVLFPQILERERRLHESLAARIPAPAPETRPGGPAVPAFSYAEFLRTEINREVGKRLERGTGKRVDFEHPQLTYRIDTRFDHATLQVASLFLKGRYRKLARGLPQTRWPCRSCGGLGCRACSYRGKTYDESVEELIAAPVMAASGATDHALHGMGREDIDARMLGTGRPFILELKNPRRRTLDLRDLERRIAGGSLARVEALGLAPAQAAEVAAFKQADPEKTYRAKCRAERPISPDSLKKVLSSFRGVTLGQRTPERVAHRRADLVRRRRILDVGLVEHTGDRFELEIRAEAGTYIKEFVSGDAGRTTPSLTEALGVPAVVEELDVVDVAWK